MKRKFYFLIFTTILLSALFFPTTILATSKISEKLDLDLNQEESTTLNVIIKTRSYDYSKIKSVIKSSGGNIKNEFKYTKALAAEVSIKSIKSIKEIADVEKIFKDEIRRTSSLRPDLNQVDLDKYISTANPLSNEKMKFKELSFTEIEKLYKNLPDTYWNYMSTGVNSVWGKGIFGQDSLAVIIDTGVYADHLMIGRDTAIGGIDISSDVNTSYEGWDLSSNHYHGTHCAGILAGAVILFLPGDTTLMESFIYHTGIKIPAVEFGGPEGYYALPLFGMAPMAKIYGIKVFDHTGAGAFTSTIIAGIEHAISLHEQGIYDIDVISMSLGGGTGFDGRDLESQVVDYATSMGITVVSSAGNDGPGSTTIGRPACSNTAIAVAASADPINSRIFWDNIYDYTGIGDYLFTSEIPQIIYFSSRGLTSDGRLKPDISATGFGVFSALTGTPDSFGWASGTSMSCPAVAGTVALLNSWGEFNGASPYDYKQALKSGSTWIEGYSKVDQGSGLLNAEYALDSLMSDYLLGESHPDLRKGYGRKPVKPNGLNTGIVGQGEYSFNLEDISPGHYIEYYFKASSRTDFLSIEVSNVELGTDIGINSFEVTIQSPVRTSLDAPVYSFNVYGDAYIEFKDYKVSSRGALFGNTTIQENTFQPGYYKVVIENDFTSFDSLSGSFEINVKQDRPFWSNGKKAPKPDVKYSGEIATDEFVGFIPVGAGENGVNIELWWKNDWTWYPTSDLDMVIAWYNSSGSLFYNLYDGGSLRSPEGVYLPEAVDAYVLIYGYETYGKLESWNLYAWY